MVDPLPVALLGPEPEVVVAGLPRGQIVRHHPPCPAGADDVEDAIEDAAPRVLPRTPPLAEGACRQERSDEIPFGIGQTARVIRHPELLQYMS